MIDTPSIKLPEPREPLIVRVFGGSFGSFLAFLFFASIMVVLGLLSTLDPSGVEPTLIAKCSADDGHAHVDRNGKYLGCTYGPKPFAHLPPQLKGSIKQ